MFRLLSLNQFNQMVVAWLLYSYFMSKLLDQLSDSIVFDLDDVDGHITLSTLTLSLFI